MLARLSGELMLARLSRDLLLARLSRPLLGGAELSNQCFLTGLTSAGLSGLCLSARLS